MKKLVKNDLKENAESFIEETLEKRKKNNKVNDLLQKSAFLVAIALGIAAFVYFFVEKESSYKLNGNVVQYYANSIYEFDSNATLKENMDHETILYQNDTEKVMTSLVLYVENTQKIILPKSMVYVDPRNATSKKVDRFTEIKIENNSIIASFNGEEVILNPGFLYDGEDYFVFLEETSAEFNGYYFDLAPLSYVEADYNNYTTVFDYGDKEMDVEQATTEVEVKAGTDYTVQLFNGVVTLNNGTKSLLFSEVDLLDSIFE